MPMRLICLSLLAVCIALPTAHIQAEEESPLADAMGTMKSKLRKVKRAAGKGEFSPELLQHVHDAQVASLASKAMVPSIVTKAPADKQAAMTADYRRRMVESTIALLELELALLKKDQDQVSAILDKLKEQESKGHEVYRPDE